MPIVNFSEVDTVEGEPHKLRLQSFKKYFDDWAPDEKDLCDSIYYFISMPPFRNFKYFFSHDAKVILDIRDGWSIAQASGYGGNVKKKPIKSWVTRKIEWFLIRQSYVTITCTPGLQRYLQKVSGRKVLLVPNGISDQRLSLIKNLKQAKRIASDEKKALVFVCAGKFAEYGVEKVKKLLSVVVERYGDKPTEIILIGSDPVRNEWVKGYYSELSKGHGKVILLPRMREKELFKIMLETDYGLSLIRDPNYDFGTKIYDYIALGLPVVNYFEKPNNFTDYFNACMDVGFSRKSVIPEIRRSVLIEQGLKDIEF